MPTENSSTNIKRLKQGKPNQEMIPVKANFCRNIYRVGLPVQFLYELRVYCRPFDCNDCVAGVKVNLLTLMGTA
jgi:hypothetical protein